MNVDIQKELQKAKMDLIRLLGIRERIEQAIAKQKRKIAAWTELADAGEFSDAASIDLSLTEACVTVLRSTGKQWASISDIQNDLREIGFPLDKYKAAAASITTTVNRMEDEGSVVSRKLAGGVKEYKWVGPKELREAGKLLPMSKLLGEPLDPSQFSEDIRTMIYGPIRRATPASGSFAARDFAERDAKERKSTGLPPPPGRQDKK